LENQEKTGKVLDNFLYTGTYLFSNQGLITIVHDFFQDFFYPAGSKTLTP